MNDAQIVARVLAGERDAFGILVERYTAKIYRISMSICRDRFLAEEAMQEAFIDAYLHLGSLAEPESFEFWLGTIARRKSFRMVSSRRSCEDIDDFDNLIEGASSPEENVIAEEKRLIIRRAISRLSPTLSRAVRLFYLEGVSV